MRIQSTISALAGFIILFGQSIGLADPPKTNFIIIFNDDQGYQDLGCFGSPDIKTPHVDKLAKEGIRMTDFLVASPICSPSRAALMTGRYPRFVGVPNVLWPDRPGGLNPEHVTIAETLKTVGYATAAVGKWHLGDKPQYLPTNQGFDSYYGIPYSNDMFPASDMKYASDCLFREGYSQQTLKEAFADRLNDDNKFRRAVKNKVPLMRDEECIEFPTDQSTITRRFADESIQFISESVKAGKPFFLYLANSMPHIPLYASEEFLGKSQRGLYGDVIEEIDYNTGRIMEHLDQLGVADNTLVIFTSDNGPWLEQKEHGGSAFPLFEGKFTTFEGGQRVPCVMRWPTEIPAGSVCSEMASTIDLLPTLANIAGAKLPDITLDGKNILPLLTEKGSQSPHEYFFYTSRGEAVRSGEWKYHKVMHFKVKETARKFTGPALYNLKNDIGESHNVIDQHPEIADRLAKALDEHLKRDGAKKKSDNDS